MVMADLAYCSSMQYHRNRNIEHTYTPFCIVVQHVMISVANLNHNSSRKNRLNSTSNVRYIKNYILFGIIIAWRSLIAGNTAQVQMR